MEVKDNFFVNENLKENAKAGSLFGELQDIYFWIQSYDYQQHQTNVQILKLNENNNTNQIVQQYNMSSLSKLKNAVINQRNFIYGLNNQGQLYLQPIDLKQNNTQNILIDSMNLNPYQYNSEFKDCLIKENQIYLINEKSIQKYDLETNQKISEQKIQLKIENYFLSSPQSVTGDIFLINENDIYIYDQELNLISEIPQLTSNSISSIDSNPNRSSQIIVCSDELIVQFFDYWMFLNTNYQLYNNDSLITCATFNHFYDNLILYGNDIGSLRVADIFETSSKEKITGEKTENKLNIIQNEYVFEQPVESLAWNQQEAWYYCATAGNKIYIDCIKQKERFDAML